MHWARPLRRQTRGAARTGIVFDLFIMSPVIDKIYTDAYQPFSENKISVDVALERGAQPLREFMLRQTRQSRSGPVRPAG